MFIRMLSQDHQRARLAGTLTGMSSHGVPSNIIFNKTGREIQLADYNSTSSYITCLMQELEQYIRRYGDDGVSRLNSVCFNHSIGLTAAAAEQIPDYPSCDIKDGSLRVLFQENWLGANCFSGIWGFEAAVNSAVDPNEQSPSLSFIAAQSVKKFDAKIEAIRVKAVSMLQFPSLKLTADFETIFTKLKAVKRDPSYWAHQEKLLGDTAFDYFKSAFLEVIRVKFENSDVSCEAFRETIFRAEVRLRIVEKPDELGGFTFEAVIEEGVLYIQVSRQLNPCRTLTN
jgi:hypothetical protein